MELNRTSMDVIEGGLPDVNQPCTKIVVGTNDRAIRIQFLLELCEEHSRLISIRAMTCNDTSQ